MKNNRVVESFNKIMPGEARKERILNMIFERVLSEESSSEKVVSIKKKFVWKRLAPVAACLVLAIALIAVSGNNAGWFGKNITSAFTITAYAADNNEIAFADFDDEKTVIYVDETVEKWTYHDSYGNQYDGTTSPINLEFRGDNLQTVFLEYPNGTGLTVNCEATGSGKMGVGFPEGSLTGTVIKATATFKDGSTRTKDIVFNPKN
ncbi:MAG: hypothetical protein ACRCZU_07270 [Selenomonadaceae bacterium]